MKHNNKKRIDTYDTIYDVKIVICNEYVTIKDIQSRYTFYDFTKITEESLGSTVGCTLRCIETKTNDCVILLWFRKANGNNKQERLLDKMNTIAHECSHVVMDIHSKIGAIIDTENQEMAAYLHGYVFKCAYKTLML